jgi:hypothetical protein
MSVPSFMPAALTANGRWVEANFRTAPTPKEFVSRPPKALTSSLGSTFGYRRPNRNVQMVLRAADETLFVQMC